MPLKKRKKRPFLKVPVRYDKVAPPTQEPEDTGGKWLYLSPQWYKHVQGLIAYLENRELWDAPPAEIDRTVQRVLRIEAQDLTPVTDCADCYNCAEYPTNDAFVMSFAPTNPFGNLLDVAPGYLTPAWFAYTGNPIPGIDIAAGLIGLQVGDVLTTPFILSPGGSPVDAIANLITIIAESGLPRFRIRVMGQGELELHLLKIPQGGYALVTVDGTPRGVVELASTNAAEFLDVLDALDTILGLSIEGGLFADEIVELDIQGDGEHEIIVTMIPKIGIPNILETGFGGGVRKVVWCRGTEKVSRPAPEPVTPDNPYWQWIFRLCASQQEECCCEDDFDCCECCESEDDDMCRCGCNGGQNSVRFNPQTGQMEYNNNGTWTPIPPTALPGESPVPAPSPDDTPAQGQECWKANGVWGTISRFLEAVFDVYTEPGPALINNSYWRFSNEYAGIGFRTVSLFGFSEEWGNDHEDVLAFETQVNLNLITHMRNFVCAAQNRFAKNNQVSDEEIAWIRAYDFNTGDPDLDEFLNDVLNLPENETYRIDSYNAVQAEFGTCSCDGDVYQPEPGEGPGENCYQYEYLQSTCPYVTGNLGSKTPASLIAEGDCGGFGTFSGGQLQTTGSYTSDSGGYFAARGGALFELTGDPGLELLGVTVAYDFSGAPNVLYREVIVGVAAQESDNFGGTGIQPSGNSGTHFFDLSVSHPFPKFIWLMVHANIGNGNGSNGVGRILSATLHLQKDGVQFQQILTIQEFCPPEAP